MWFRHRDILCFVACVTMEQFCDVTVCVAIVTVIKLHCAPKK